jgi:hypothetical protein
MAFQDTSYTIILDAVLTDIGRKRMVQGDFKVAKFAMGDDEIDYGLWKVGSDSFDPQPDITSTPILEAFAGQNASILNGLIDYGRLDIYYLPEIVINHDRVAESATPHSDHKSGSYYLSVNEETTEKLKLSSALSSDKYILESNSELKTKLLIESGINILGTTTIADDKLAKERYLMQMNLYDSYFIVAADSRFVENVLSQPQDSYFKTDAANNLYMNFEPLQRNVKVSLSPVVDYYESYRISATDTEIFAGNTGAGTSVQNANSALIGPRGTVIALNFNIFNELCGDSTSIVDDSYYIFGTRSSDLFSDGNLYDYIDTTIYIEGLSSNAQLQVPIRITRYAGA